MLRPTYLHTIPKPRSPLLGLRILDSQEMPYCARIPYRPLFRPIIACPPLRNECLPTQLRRGLASGHHAAGHSSPVMPTASATQYDHFFHYTSGRWLWGEQSRLRERRRVFNVEELQRIAAKSVGAKSCVSMTKVAEGGFNKVFRLVMNSGAVVIVRIPNPNAGPAHRITASEVATMDFVRCPGKIESSQLTFHVWLG